MARRETKSVGYKEVIYADTKFLTKRSFLHVNEASIRVIFRLTNVSTSLGKPQVAASC